MSVKYDNYFSEASKKYGVDKQLLIAVAETESGINTYAVSSAGAVGVMQLMPATARSLGVSNSFNAKENIMGGAKYLSQLLEQFDGNTELALSAYNAGASRVKESGEVLSYTEDYVNKVMSKYSGSSNDRAETTERKESTSYDLKWWGDVVRVVIVILIIVLAVVLVSVGVGNGAKSAKTDIIKTIIGSKPGVKNEDK